MTEQVLFPNAVPKSTSSQGELTRRRLQVRHSALWAAYGDALGRISELTDKAGLKRRTAGKPLCQPIRWKRRIGGISGVIELLPIGCYSDDSQLRLATGRAIRPDGFDVEAFAKVELPVWLSYALGGGKSTSAASMNLAKAKVPWFANTFIGWTNSGGNGAAMRIQPHVWAAAAPSYPESFLLDVVRNAICTHSHPTALMGAVLHALTLANTIDTGCLPTPDDLLKATRVAAELPKLMQNDREVASYWRATFEREVGSFSKEWERTVAEAEEVIRKVRINPSSASSEARYAEIIDRLRLREKACRGSGLLTAVAAVGLTWCETQPEEALRIATNAIGTDTDTIATMAGAILGTIAQVEPPVKVLDADLFCSEADRLAEIAGGKQPPSHRYPDLLNWSAPRTHADALTCSESGGLHVLGLGPAKAQSEPKASRQKDFSWQWLKLEIGQTLFIKRRKMLERDVTISEQPPHPTTHDVARRELDNTLPEKEMAQKSGSLNLKRAVDYVREHRDNDQIVGKALRRVVSEGSIGEIAVFTASLIDILQQPGEQSDLSTADRHKI